MSAINAGYNNAGFYDAQGTQLTINAYYALLANCVSGANPTPGIIVIVPPLPTGSAQPDAIIGGVIARSPLRRHRVFNNTGFYYKASRGVIPANTYVHDQ